MGLFSASWICILTFGICEHFTSSSLITKAEAEK